MSRGVPGVRANPTMDGHTYLCRGYEAARQKRRYQTDPAYRLDRINRTRKRMGIPPATSLDEVKLRGVGA